jgi:hypothetical protein
MNIIQELCGYGYVTMLGTEELWCVETGRNRTLTAPEDSSLLGCYILFTVNNLSVLQRMPSFSGSVTVDQSTLKDDRKLEPTAFW